MEKDSNGLRLFVDLSTFSSLDQRCSNYAATQAKEVQAELGSLCVQAKLSLASTGKRCCVRRSRQLFLIQEAATCIRDDDVRTPSVLIGTDVVQETASFHRFNFDWTAYSVL